MAVVVTALFASAAAFFIQTAAQRHIGPTRTAVILASEPAFAGLFGFVLLHERLTGRGWVGAALILAGILAAELAPKRFAAA
jgi:drug/metabolite transporter (DMT)-like permease